MFLYFSRMGRLILGSPFKKMGQVSVQPGHFMVFTVAFYIMDRGFRGIYRFKEVSEVFDCAICLFDSFTMVYRSFALHFVVFAL